MRALCKRENKPFVLIIDAINEHPNLPAFAPALELCIDRLLERGFIRVLLTCRSEYFDFRFKNFKNATFFQHTHVISDLHRTMEPSQTARMLERYFDFYNIRPPMSPAARDKLRSDPLLLRIFCEAYGDPSGANITNIPFLPDIYRDRLFSDYLDKKLQELADRRVERGATTLGGRAYYFKPLMAIVNSMVVADEFWSVSIAKVSLSDLEPIEELLNEDMIIRRDVPSGNSVDTHDDVIAFPFDELRDYLIATYLVVEVFQNDPDGFLVTTRNLLKPNHAIAEGIARFLFFIAKRSDRQRLLDLVSDEDWYKETFLDGIFAVEDQLVTPSDVEEIQRRYTSHAYASRQISHALIFRFDDTIYPRLNISHLFAIWDDLTIEQFDTYVAAIFRTCYHKAYWPIEQVSESVTSAVLDAADRQRPLPERLIELLFYLLGVAGNDYVYPARNALLELFSKEVDGIDRILLQQMGNLSLLSSAYRWDFAADLQQKGVVLPKELIAIAVRHWTELQRLGKEWSNVKVSLEQFLAAAIDSGLDGVPQAIQLELHTNLQSRADEWAKWF